MTHRHILAMAALAMSAVPAEGLAQRTSWGDPDLQ